MTMTQQSDFIDMYANWAQMQVNIIDPNEVFAEWGRGTGKTDGVIGPRTIRVAGSMPQETAAFAHRTYAALFMNVIPGLLSYYRTPHGPKNEPILREGIDYVYGEKDLPKHFKQPRYPILHPEHTIVYANGFNIRLVATDQADSIAGANIVHAFLEEMKHSKGERLRSRIFPAFRVGKLSQGASQTHLSPYFRGITGVSDSARVTLGEDNWFQEYEKKTDRQLQEDIVTLSLHINKAMLNIRRGYEPEKNGRIVNRYTPMLNDMRRRCTLYLRVSTFVNRDVLGADYFTKQFGQMDPTEFLSSICSVRDITSENSFFELFDEDKHTFDDSYKYENMMKLTLKDSFTLDACFLKHFDRTKKIILGYDPGSFRSMVAAQEDKDSNTLRILKEFYVYSPDDIPELCAKFNAFFGAAAGNKHIDFWYDRAGNKKEHRRQNETDAREMKAELQKYGWIVAQKNVGQATIYHWQHHRLWKRLLANNERNIPRILIDANECPYLISAIHSCKKVPGSSPVELDKKSEKTVPLHLQMGLTPQIPSGMMYMVWGLYSRYLPGSVGGSQMNFMENMVL